MMELGSSWAAELTVSLAPITNTKSVSGKSSFNSSISRTTSYGMPASAVYTEETTPIYQVVLYTIKKKSLNMTAESMRKIEKDKNIL